MMSKKPKMPKAGNPMKDAVSMPRFGARAMRPGGMKKGGGVHPDAAMDRKLIRKEIARAEKMEDKAEAKGMKAGGGVKKMMRGGMPGAGLQTMPAPAGGGVRGGPTPAGGGVRTMPAGGSRPLPVGKPAPAGMGSGPRSLPVGKPAPAGMGSGPRSMPVGSGPKRTMPAPAGGGVRTMPAGGGVQTMPGAMKKGGYVKMARGGGVETKGKTKGKFI